MAELISFVIPCYRSALTIEGVVEEVTTAMAALPAYDYEMILVNDCSPDNTFEVIKKICAGNSKIKGISLAKNFGQHAALMAGLRNAKGDITVCLDDDGQTPADEVGKLLAKIEEGYDVVYAKYEHKKHNLFRNFGSKINELMTRYMLGKPKELYISSYFAARRFVVEEVTRYENAYPYVIGLVLRSTKSITNVVVQHREREIGTSGYTLKKLFGLWVNGFTSFSVKPLRLATMLGAINAFLGFAYALYTVIKKLINPAVPVGFSSMMSAIMFIGGMVMLMLGMIGEYIGRIYVCMNNSPQYVIKETVNEEKKAVKIILWALLILYGAMCTFLYYKQTFHVEGMPYESDLPYHIKMAVEDHWFYSLTAILYQLFFMTPFGEILTAVFLGAVTVVTVPATKWLFQEIERRYSEKESSENVLFLLAFLCNIAMPFFVRAAHYQRYIGWQSATVWHNSTYLCMKLCGILAVAVYLRLEKKYREGLKVSEWLLLAFLFALSSAVKPSFLMVFAPIMAVYLLIDLFHKVSLKKIIIFGLTVIPSLLVILWQNMVLFGQDTGNGIEIRYGYTLTLHSTHPKVTLLLSVAFPVFVLLFMLKELLKDKWYLFAWLVWGMGLLQVTFLAESGRRARDGNFQWGYAFGIFLVMVFSIVKVLQMCKAPKGIFKNKYVRVGFLTAGTGIFAYQCYCGIVFFSKLCSGITYWM